MIDWELTARLAGAIAAAVALVLLLSGAALGLGLRRLRRQAQSEAACSAAGFREMGAELAQLAAANLALREYLVSLSERFEQSQQAAATQSAPATGRAYELAARLAAGGAPSTELVAHCGLTRAEADLAVLVHGARRRAANSH